MQIFFCLGMQRTFLAAAPGALCRQGSCRPRLSPFLGQRVPWRTQLILDAHLTVRKQAPRRATPERVSAVAGGWVTAAAALGGILVGLLLAKLAQTHLTSAVDADFKKYSAENALLRAKVEELQQMISKYEPMAYKDMRLRFTKGVNKTVILGLVDSLLANKEVNIWWLPDSLERVLYFNVISLVLSVLDEMVEGMSMNFAGHNVKLQLSFLDLEEKVEVAGAATGADQRALLRPAA